MAVELGALSAGGERRGRLFAWVEIPPEDAAILGPDGVQGLSDTGRRQAQVRCARLVCALAVVVYGANSGSKTSVVAECNGLICVPNNNNMAIEGFCVAAKALLDKAGIPVVQSGLLSPEQPGSDFSEDTN